MELAVVRVMLVRVAIRREMTEVSLALGVDVIESRVEERAAVRE